MRGEFRVNSGAWNISAVLTATPGWITTNQRSGSSTGVSISPRPSAQADDRARKLAHRRPGAAQRCQLVRLQAQCPRAGSGPPARWRHPSCRRPGHRPAGCACAAGCGRPARQPVARCSSRAARTHEVRLGRRCSAGPAIALDAARRQWLEADLVAPVEQLEERLQVVITVGAAAGDMQEQVELGRRRPPGSQRHRRRSVRQLPVRTRSAHSRRAQREPPRQPLRAGATVVLVIDRASRPAPGARAAASPSSASSAGMRRIAARRAASSAGSRSGGSKPSHAATRRSRLRPRAAGRCWSRRRRVSGLPSIVRAHRAPSGRAQVDSRWPRRCCCQRNPALKPSVAVATATRPLKLKRRAALQRGAPLRPGRRRWRRQRDGSRPAATCHGEPCARQWTRSAHADAVRSGCRVPDRARAGGGIGRRAAPARALATVSASVLLSGSVASARCQTALRARDRGRSATGDFTTVRADVAVVEQPPGALAAGAAPPRSAPRR